MSSVFSLPPPVIEEPSREKSKKANNTAHLKVMPETKDLRERIRREAAAFTRDLDRSMPLTKTSLQAYSVQLLERMGLGIQYTGYVAVCISNEFWREQLMSIDFSRRLLLLPHCLKHAEGCPADYDELGLDCRKCGACSVADFKTRAEDLGYKVLVAEGTPIVLKIIVSGHIDGIVGVSCLNVLEKAIDKVLQVGVPSIAVPLLSSNCKNTSVDEDWVMEVIGLRTEAPRQKTRSYVHLMRASNHMFNGDMDRLVARGRPAPVPGEKLDPLARTEEIALDWLREGGKRFRPFITLATYDALRGGEGTLGDDKLQLTDSVRRVAMAIETFHKASLVHDDIEDDDTFRYGRATLHRQHGVPTAINLGDYLIGLGYRLVSRDRSELGGDVTADILNRMAEAHLKLAEGQGAELLWRDAPDKALSPLEALKIYALKTSPAFEAALYAGVRLAGPIDNYEKLVSEFCKNLGVAFQILNDLKDWEGDADNKLVSGQDVLGGRPTLLMALALEGANANHRKQLLDIFGQTNRDPATVEIVRDIYARTQVFDKAEKLVEKFKAKCEALADETQPTEFRELLYFLVDNVLERTPPEEPHHEHEHHHDQGHHHHGHGHGHGGLVQLGIVARSR